MSSNKSPANSSGAPLRVSIREAVEEFRTIAKAIKEAIQQKKPPIDTKKLLDADSTEKALKEQGISGDVYIDFISALARAESESSRVSQAPPGQERGRQLP